MRGNIYRHGKGYQVRFGRKICKYFTDLATAERFLNGLRYETDKGTFDVRDYQQGSPLGFETLSAAYLKLKKPKISDRYYRSIAGTMRETAAIWGNRNIKAIQYGEIEDYLSTLPELSSKTLYDRRETIMAFLRWCKRRRYIEDVPEAPPVKVEMQWRNIIDLETQNRIVSEVHRITDPINPRLWIAISFLSKYISVRPRELINVQEKDINLVDGTLLIRRPKERRPKLVYLLDEDIELLRSFPRGMPWMYFFRHEGSRRGLRTTELGKQFSEILLYRWWKRACKNLGIAGIDLYGGTRHSTATALGGICTPEQVKDATGHCSPAFARYFQGQAARSRGITAKIIGLRRKKC